MPQHRARSSKQPQILTYACALAILVSIFSSPFRAGAQVKETSSQASATNVILPNLVRFNGRATDASGKPLSGLVGITFALYEQQTGSPALWLETQNVQLDANGHYSVLLGASNPNGLPNDVFSSGQARWVGVQVSGQAEQPRVMLLAVPYAMKAGDAATLGGLPPSAFMPAGPVAGGAPSTASPSSSLLTTATVPPPTASNVTTSGGTVNTIPLFTTNTNIQNSAVTQSGSGATAKIGIGTTAPVTTLDVKGTSTLRGNISLPATGTATTAAGNNSQPVTFTASVFNSSSTTPVNENFRWQAEPVGNNTTTATGSLNLLYAQGTGAMAETGLKLGHNGLITFAPGQTFPGTGKGTITGVTAGTDLTGGGTGGSVTLNLDTSKVPQLNASNTFTASQSVTGGIYASGEVSGATGFFGNTPGSTALTVNQNTDGAAIEAFSADSNAVFGVSDTYDAIVGLAGAATFAGVFGETTVQGGYGVYAINQSAAGQALWAETDATTSANGSGPDAVHGISHGPSGAGVAGINDASGGFGVYGRQLISGSYAGRFDGDVWVNGNLSKNGGSFKIDHPLDPSNKYLYHSFVESPDMKNIYDGVAILDASGEAVVTMPEWFGALNRDFRYQLTCIGGFAPVYIAEEMANNQFKVGGGKPGMKVSWQVTGTRQDAWANAHRIPVEQIKPQDEHGTYLHPELFGAPEQAAVGWGRYRWPDNVQPHKALIPPAPRNRRTVKPASTATLANH